MRLFVILFTMLLSACATPPSGNIQTPAQSDTPSPRETVSVLTNKIKYLCIEPEYAVYFAKTFCTPSELNLAMMSDRSRITQAQKTAFNAWAQAYDKLADELNEALALTSAANKQMADYNKMIAFPAAQKNRMALYEGKITWGVYNRKRKEIYDGMAAESQRVVQQNI
jgi:hypothetical protein